MEETITYGDRPTPWPTATFNEWFYSVGDGIGVSDSFVSPGAQSQDDTECVSSQEQSTQINTCILSVTGSITVGARIINNAACRSFWSPASLDIPLAVGTGLLCLTAVDIGGYIVQQGILACRFIVDPVCE